MDDVAITLEHVDLLNSLDRLRVQLLQGSLELLVVVGAAGHITLLLVPGSALSTYSTRRSPPSVSLGIHLAGVGSTSILMLSFCIAADRRIGTDNIPVRAGAAPPNFFLSSSWMSAILLSDKDQVYWRNVRGKEGQFSRWEKVRVLSNRKQIS